MDSRHLRPRESPEARIMKLHIAFLLLAIFGAAQAGKKMEAMTFGTGYTHMGGGDDYSSAEGGDVGSSMADASADIVNANTDDTQEASNVFGSKSESYSSSADTFQELYRDKKEAAAKYANRAKNLANAANEAYKHAQLYKKEAGDKQAIAKEYEERAQKHERLSKQQDMKEMDDMRKNLAETSEGENNLRRANSLLVMANMYADLGQMFFGESGDLEQYASAIANKAEEYERYAENAKEKAKNDKENARMHESKGKEEEEKANEEEAKYNELSKKLRNHHFYKYEFMMKAETERYHSECSRIRSSYLHRLAEYLKQQSETLRSFSTSEKTNGDFFRRMAAELEKQKKMLIAAVTQMMKNHQFSGSEIVSKPNPYPGYHESY